MSYYYGIPTLLLRFLGACMFGDPRSYYGMLCTSELSELKTQGQSFGMTAWFYRYLHNVLPEEKRLAYQKTYQARQVKAILGGYELKRLYGVLESHGLRFAPIKGADLAYRLYPDAALRNFGDWDIWFHPDDCERALAVLAEDGWKVPEVSTTELNPDQIKARHHYVGHIRGQYRIEPHFTLANFEEIAPNELWNHTLDYPDGDGQRVLSPEMNLLMLTRHAASDSYFHAQLPKLLTDAAVIIQRNEVDFDELRKMANGWNLPFPGDLLAAFPEFFPSEVIAKFNSKKAEVFRQLFEARGRLGRPASATLFLSRYEIRGRIVGCALKHIKTYRTPAKMRLYYHLPAHGAWGSLALAYFCWFWTRLWKVRFGVLRNPGLREYAYIVETVESA